MSFDKYPIPYLPLPTEHQLKCFQLVERMKFENELYRIEDSIKLFILLVGFDVDIDSIERSSVAVESHCLLKVLGIVVEIGCFSFRTEKSTHVNSQGLDGYFVDALKFAQAIDQLKLKLMGHL